MKQNDIEPNNLTFPFIAKACAKLSDLIYSQMIHGHVVKSPFDVASWNAMLVGFAQMGFLEKVLRLFYNMRLVGIQADFVTVMGLTQAAIHAKHLSLLKSVHSFGIHIGVDADVSVCNTWISSYAKCDDLKMAELVFCGIEEGLRTVVSWNSMVAGCTYGDKFDDSLNFYRHMMYDGFRLDVTTVVSLLSSFVCPEALVQGRLVHSHGIHYGFDLDVSVINTLISMYSKCGDIDSARVLFDGICDRTRVSWTAMISGYAQKGDLDEALRLFFAMEAAGELPDLVTVLSMISGCGQSGALELGKWFDNYACSGGLKDNVMVCNALIDMYSKCGSIGDARELFYALPEKIVVSWTTMIAGCALNGEFVEALDLFHQLMELDLRPNRVTFLAVLQACTHTGFLEKGWAISIIQYDDKGISCKSGIRPLLLHGRPSWKKRKLKEALDFVQSMPIKSDAGIWGALLCACKIHLNIEIAPYVEMANKYALGGRWDGVANIRTMMKRNQVKKFPGQSLFHINGKTCTFTAEDRYHAESELTYPVLDCLALHSREEAYSSHLKWIPEHEAG
ncbi:pentatricopeptide repeat-containing protein [Citrus sinensis]|uniref:Pentatricopeptide repeat-containing protein n=1 Tax=Citrus sinensis TaxID=2711 RepID=A0ACB8JM77_CITSI|nr:pentatricopeptide repeat-containing protein [Citrus sinensis]